MENLLTLSALGPLCAFGSSVTWAIGSAGYARLSQDHSPFAVNFARALVALPLFVIAAFITAGGWGEGLASFQSVRAAHWGWFTISMTASYGLGDTLFIWSTRSLGVPGALSIASCFPIWTALAGFLFYGETIDLTQMAGMGLSILGVVLVVLNGTTGNRQLERNSEQKNIPWRGIGLAAICSVAWAANSFCVARGGADLAPPVGNAIRMIMALVLTAFFGKLIAPREKLLLPLKKGLAFLWLFVFEAFGGSYFYIYGLSHSSLALGSTLASLAPVVSVPVALALGSEKFSFLRTVGVFFVVIGIGLLIKAF
jgi:drug/metabolite transporter (DMT)-like permease